MWAASTSEMLFHWWYSCQTSTTATAYTSNCRVTKNLTHKAMRMRIVSFYFTGINGVVYNEVLSRFLCASNIARKRWRENVSHSLINYPGLEPLANGCYRRSGGIFPPEPPTVPMQLYKTLSEQLSRCKTPRMLSADPGDSSLIFVVTNGGRGRDHC
ncbi:hypothetical protein RRG08_049818 [Elysia crispata]|uniref:Uncharacterized protein n=1 Tax=Elysia crispata TaxID=231223 RepID=A0AAE0XPM6_9GAST|nr:hypothetical protein RRG08_049818 [Elysia crispata]